MKRKFALIWPFMLLFAAPLHAQTDTEADDSVKVSRLEMPNAFTPNGDGINDVYQAKSNHENIVEFRATIFNRHGQRIYEWKSVDGGWDGTFHGQPVKDGAYFVRVIAKGADGRTYDIKKDVNLLRKFNETTDTK